MGLLLELKYNLLEPEQNPQYFINNNVEIFEQNYLK